MNDPITRASVADRAAQLKAKAEVIYPEDVFNIVVHPLISALDSARDELADEKARAEKAEKRLMMAKEVLTASSALRESERTGSGREFLVALQSFRYVADVWDATGGWEDFLDRERERREQERKK